MALRNVTIKRIQVFSTRFHNSSMTWNAWNFWLLTFDPKLFSITRFTATLAMVEFSSVFLWKWTKLKSNFLPDFNRTVFIRYRSKTTENRSEFIYNATKANIFCSLIRFSTIFFFFFDWTSPKSKRKKLFFIPLFVFLAKQKALLRKFRTKQWNFCIILKMTTWVWCQNIARDECRAQLKIRLLSRALTLIN